MRTEQHPAYDWLVETIAEDYEHRPEEFDLRAILDDGFRFTWWGRCKMTVPGDQFWPLVYSHRKG